MTNTKDAQHPVDLDRGDPPANPYRRATLILAFFVLSFVPVVLGATWLANTLVYAPLCERDGGEVTSIDQYSASISTGGQPAGCHYADGTQVDLGEVIGIGPALGVSIGVTVFRFGLPFLLTWLLVRVLPARE